MVVEILVSQVSLWQILVSKMSLWQTHPNQSILLSQVLLGVPTQARKQKKVAPVKHQIRREKNKMNIRI